MITEAWCTSETTNDSLKIDNYNLFRGDRETGRGGGTLIYTEKSLGVTQFSNSTLSQLSDSVWVQIKVARSKPILMGCVYPPPSSSQEYDKILSSIFDFTANLPFAYKIIGGDFNMPEVSWQSPRGPPRYDNLLNSIVTGGWIQHINSPTRSANILDLMFTNNIAPSTIHVGHEFPGSDHKIVVCSFNIFPEKLRVDEVGRTPVRLYKHADWNLYQYLIRGSNWDSYFTNDSLEEVLNIFYRNIRSIHNVIAPEKILSFKFSQSDYIPTPLRRSLRKHSIKYYRCHDLSSLIAITSVLSRIQELKNCGLKNKEMQAIQSPHSSGEIAKLFKSRLTNSKTTCPKIIHIDGIAYESADRLCELFSTHFAGLYTKENDQVVDFPSVTNKCLSDILFTTQEIGKAISTLSSLALLIQMVYAPFCLKTAVMT